MSRDTMEKPLKRDKQKPKEPENPNSVINVLKRGFMPKSERAVAQVEADRQAEVIKRRKANGEYAED